MMEVAGAIIAGLIGLMVLALIIVFAFVDTTRYFYLGEVPQYVINAQKAYTYVTNKTNILVANIFSQYLLFSEKLILYSTQISIGIFSIAMYFVA